jgi:outer membrane lipoprotein SlyB
MFIQLEAFMRTTNYRAIYRAIGVTSSVLLLSTLAACVAPMQTSDSAYPAPYPTQYPAQFPGQYPQGGYPAAGYPAQNPQRAYTEYGRVSNVEVLRTPEQGRGSGVGAVLGGVAGAVLGHQIGGGSGRDAATVVGAVGGAVAGNAIEKNRNTTVRESYRVSIQLDNGSSRAYDVPSYGELRVGDRVRIENGQIFRM